MTKTLHHSPDKRVYFMTSRALMTFGKCKQTEINLNKVNYLDL